MRGYRTIVVKRTVVPGTTQSVVEPLLRRATRKGPGRLGIAANPEFLSEGRMVHDALHPERIVVGATDGRSFRRIAGAYRGFDAPILKLSPSGAELVKYASNAFLALKVSFANELSHWTENLGGNVDEVVVAVGADPRIGQAFLRAGPGFGGSCFDKDLRAFLGRAEGLGIRVRSAETALAINREQTDHSFALIRDSVGVLRRKSVAVLGLAFKAGTDDVRESRAFPIIERLLAAGARVRGTRPGRAEQFPAGMESTSGVIEEPGRVLYLDCRSASGGGPRGDSGGLARLSRLARPMDPIDAGSPGRGPAADPLFLGRGTGSSQGGRARCGTPNGQPPARPGGDAASEA